MAGAAAGATGRWGMGRVVGTAMAGALGASGATAFYYRPHPDETGVGLTPRPPLASPRQLVDQAAAEEPVLMQWARFVAIAFIAGVSRTYLLALNDMRIREDEHYDRFLRLVQDREPGQALITVSNHVSTLDDPTLFAAMLPWSVNLQPHLVRWSVCSQEICFKNDAVSAFFGAGKVMPIQRGGGIDQKQLQDFARRVAAGDWVHLFPEGKVAQTGKLEGRDLDKARALGGDRFKWGVGKLIARAPTPPVVVPIYHTGMQNFLPIIHAERRLRSWFPQTGQGFGVVVGAPIAFDDLLDEHHRRLLAAGVARAEAAAGAAAHETVAVESWATIAAREERRLYSAITRRVEEALKALEAEANAHHESVHGQAAPGFVDPDAEAETRAMEEREAAWGRRNWWRRWLGSGLR